MQFISSVAELSHDYYMKLVPTIYHPISGGEVSGYQYTFAYKVTIVYSYILIGCAFY